MDSGQPLRGFRNDGLRFCSALLSTLELVFGIRLVEFETVSNFLFDHRTARKFVPKEVAAEVTSLIHTAVRRLVAAASPRRIVMETFEAKLPPNGHPSAYVGSAEDQR